MLKKEKRLSRGEIQALKLSSNQNRIIQGRFFGLIYQKNTLPSQFGLIIPNKIVSQATKRNRIKRLLYLAIGDNADLTTGQFLFLAKRNCTEGGIKDFIKEVADFKDKI